MEPKLYTVATIDGYRRTNLTLRQAKRHAAHLREQMRQAGWAGEVRIFYWDGSEVSWQLTAQT